VRRKTLSAGVALLVVGVTASVTTGALASKSAVSKIAIATPAKANDYGWNQQGVSGARVAAKVNGATLTVNDGIGYDNTQAVLLRLARSGNQFVIAQASGYNAIAPRVAQQTKVPMISYDNPKNLIKDYMSDIETSSQDGAYLAGVLAAKKTTTNKLGIVISAADTNWFKQAGGFVAGARSVNPAVKFSFAQVGQAAYDDAAGGKRVMQATIASGADVVFGMGDGATLGYIQAVETSSKKVWFIDVIGNPTPIDKKGAVLSSVLWDQVRHPHLHARPQQRGLADADEVHPGARVEAHPEDPQGNHLRFDQGAADARQEVGHGPDEVADRLL
jgi:basic membrane protein A